MVPATTNGDKMKGIRIDSNPETITERTHSAEWGSSNKADRIGVSVCGSWDDLVAYFSDNTGHDKRNGRTSPWHLEDDYVVVIEGVESPDEDHDAKHAGDPYLLVDVEVVDVRPLTASEVAELCWGGREATAGAMKGRIDDMCEAYDRGESEIALGLSRDEDHNLGNLFLDASGSYVVWSDDEEVVAWHELAGEYQVVPLSEL